MSKIELLNPGASIGTEDFNIKGTNVDGIILKMSVKNTFKEENVT